MSDISGMAAMPGNIADHQRFIVVSDKKDRDKPGDRGARVGVLTIDDDQGLSYADVDIPDTEWGTMMSNDLEAVCRVPGSSDTYLLMESSYLRRDDDSALYGRIFMVQITQRADSMYQGKVQRTYQLPRTDKAFNLEGLVCFRWQGGLHLILGDRTNYSAPEGKLDKCKHGTLFCASLPESSSVLEWAQLAEVVAPGFEHRKGEGFRHVSDLCLRSDSGSSEWATLWVSAAYDPDHDTGPFYSQVYVAGTLNLNARSERQLFIPNSHPQRVWRCDGLKVEALAESTMGESGLCIGTDDEDFGGIWRMLPLK